jgi:murein DD-endopeptidase MepM/ murein hydrolase activator NlpD
MRHILVFFFLFSFIFASTSIDTKIADKASTLKQKSKIERKIAKKLKDVAKEILQEQHELKKIASRIDFLTRNIEKNRNLVKDKEENLKDLTKQNSSLVEVRKKLEDKIIRIIAQDFSFYLITDRGYLDSSDSILVEEILDKMGVIMQKEFAKLSREYKHINSKIEVQNGQIHDLRSSIEELKDEKNQKADLKKKQEKIIATLSKKKAQYKKQLERVEKERQALRKTLESLKIVKLNEERKRQEALEEKRRSQQLSGEKVTVRKLGSSYQKGRFKRYNGRKTIAPLDSFSVKRKFGNYIDPIYKIKIFNESVILSSNRSNAKVKNVLDGKIIYAKDTAVLDKVVIVENRYGIHTIYAHLSQIAPTIKVGNKIRKGYIIGRVDRDLTFEVTQKNYHINPLELISVK